ncbi:MAG: putative Two-component hybrid sensor and regulator [Actinomycetia bacterium]|nr:putative Two-component hybrid sensor and regulator [Actinomycetes bacterium]
MGTSEDPPRSPQTLARRAGHRGFPVRAYLSALVVFFIVAALAGAAYGWSAARADATRTATRDAIFAARLGARAVHNDVALLQSTVARTAVTPGLGRVLADPKGCQLTFTGGDVFTAGHLDIVSPGGSVACSSRPLSSPHPNYGSAAWFAGARRVATSLGPIMDPVTGTTAFIVTAPTEGGGVLVGALNVETVGQGLASLFGGPRHIEFLVSNGDNSVAISRSIGPARWAATPQLHGRAVVPNLHWTIDAGTNRAAAVGPATTTFHRELLMILLSLLAILAAAFIAYRRMTKPISQLSKRVSATTEGRYLAPADIRGTSEILDLADNFERLVASVERELRERQLAEELARASEHNYRVLFDDNPHPMWVFDAGRGGLMEVNDAAIRNYGYAREEWLAMTIDDVQFAVNNNHRELTVPGRSASTRHIRKDGSIIEVHMTSHSLDFDGCAARMILAEDVTEHARMERQLSHTQRMESLGELAGGVAHDFNNLLTVIRNYAAFTEATATAAAAKGERDPRWAEVRSDVGEVIRAADRATDLTRQLLAFARRELVQPEVLDVSEVITDVERLLQSSIGKLIDLHATVAADTWRIVADPGHVEQVLLNLAVNARDAMPDGGRLAIAADNIQVDANYAERHHGVEPGAYMRLRVSDTGSGMSRETVERAFEPFFTTKPAGLGTGLGLATVYGIVRQAAGHVQISSEVGAGTTITVLFPATDEPVAAVPIAMVPADAGHDEMILIAEDADEIRTVVDRILTSNGYNVLVAANGAEAVDVAAGYTDDIHLLLTDLVMPDVSGHQAAETITAARPSTRVLYMSGHAHPRADPSAASTDIVDLLEKPFSADDLLAKVRATLDATSSSPPYR